VVVFWTGYKKELVLYFMTLSQAKKYMPEFEQLIALMERTLTPPEDE
jgi:hypothetical protein